MKIILTAISCYYLPLGSLSPSSSALFSWHGNEGLLFSEMGELKSQLSNNLSPQTLSQGCDNADRSSLRLMEFWIGEKFEKLLTFFGIVDGSEAQVGTRIVSVLNEAFTLSWSMPPPIRLLSSHSRKPCSISKIKLSYQLIHYSWNLHQLILEM